MSAYDIPLPLKSTFSYFRIFVFHCSLWYFSCVPLFPFKNPWETSICHNIAQQDKDDRKKVIGLKNGQIAGLRENVSIDVCSRELTGDN